MLIFAAAVRDEPRTRETPELDETLFPRIGEGDAEAFCRLYEQTGSAVYAYALAILGCREDAEDAMQETFLKIREAAHLYTPMGRPMAWMLTITRNICMMKFRQRSRISGIAPEEAPEVPDCRDITDVEDRLVLETAFRVLTREERQIVLLHAVSGLKHREIAEQLALPLSTVLSKYQRSIKKLRSQLEGTL